MEVRNAGRVRGESEIFLSPGILLFDTTRLFHAVVRLLFALLIASVMLSLVTSASGSDLLGVLVSILVFVVIYSFITSHL